MFVDTITTSQLQSIPRLLQQLSEELTLLGTQVGNPTISPLGGLLSSVSAQHVALCQGFENLHAAVELAEKQR